MSNELASLIRDLDLTPHPEGGWYREIHRSPGALELERGPRSALTVIDYVLELGHFSTFHRVASEEVWTWCAGAPLELHLLGVGGRYERFELGPQRELRQRRVAVVPASCWQAATPVRGSAAGYSWCSCIVAPGFDFADFELGGRSALQAEFPGHAALIARLTHPEGPAGPAV